MCSGCSCDGSGEEGGEMCSLLRNEVRQWWFIDIQYYQYFLNMFRVPLHPSSGGQILLRVAANGVVFWL
jgi:hypothetical protein